VGRLACVPAFFALRVASALLLLKLSASFLSVGGFTVFSQFMLFAALLNLMAVGGAQNGLIRQAAAAPDPQALARTRTAAFVIWAAAVPVLALPIVLASGRISEVLVGSPGQWPVVVAVAVAALAAGPGQIWCSILTGRKRTAASLAAQALGLVTGTAAAAGLIIRGEAAAATIAFASGGLTTMVVSAAFATRLGIPAAPVRTAMPEVRVLLRYSAALAATTGFTSIVLFGLRSHYRGAFGTVELGYWLAANRISDMSTQLLGLFMIQFFVPHIAAAPNAAARRTLALRSWAVATVGMGTILLVFTLAARPLVHLFLSDAYLAAIPSIRIYMAGDVLRVWPSLAMYAAFAAGRPGRYAGIEMGAMALMAATALALIAVGQPRAPELGYLSAYGAAAALITVVFLWRELAGRTPRLRGTALRQAE
jgi:O-antigen/teichoic acid export membrane protein